MNTAVSVGSKLPDIGTSIFAVMTRLANEHGAINLSQGFPDFDCDPALVEAVARAMRDGHNQYAPMPGLLALREAIAAKVKACYGATVDPLTEVVVTSGATAGLYATLTALVHPGRGRRDAVVVPVTDDRGEHPRGPAGAADPPGDALERGGAVGVARGRHG